MLPINVKSETTVFEVIHLITKQFVERFNKTMKKQTVQALLMRPSAEIPQEGKIEFLITPTCSPAFPVCSFVLLELTKSLPPKSYSTRDIKQLPISELADSTFNTPSTMWPSVQKSSKLWCWSLTSNRRKPILSDYHCWQIYGFIQSITSCLSSMTSTTPRVICKTKICQSMKERNPDRELLWSFRSKKTQCREDTICSKPDGV